jgi:3-oxoacyl-[acyl-carrier protein] reductase
MSDAESRQAARLIVITGASGGIGAAVAHRLATLGDRLLLVGRRIEALEGLRASLPGGPHGTAAVDVTDEKAWALVADRLDSDGRVDGLVTAAGTMGPIGPPGSWGIGEFRRTIDVNLVGTILPIVGLLAPLRAARGAVVLFSGGGATSPLPNFDAYAATKAAIVRLAENLAVELAPDGVRINCVAPGFVATAIHRATLDAGAQLAGSDFYERTRRVLEAGGDSPELAANLTAFLLSPEAEGITGRLISARWDPWEEPGFRERLRSDPTLGMLRRIDDQAFFARAQPPGS